MSHFGKLLREARKRAGLTQQELADKVGIDDSYISKMEKGIFDLPSREVVVRLANALGPSDKRDRKRIEFLFAAGVASNEDLKGFALAKIENDEKLVSRQPPPKTSAAGTVYHTPLFISSQEVLVHRLAVLKKRLEAAEKNLEDANEELRELHVLVDEMFNQE